MTDDLETKLLNADITGTCDVCRKEQMADDIFLLGIQDPLNKRVALLRICRADFVVHTQLELRTVLDKHWYG